MWAEIEEQKGIKYPRQGTEHSSVVAQSLPRNLEIAATTIKQVGITLDQMMDVMDTQHDDCRGEIDEMDATEEANMT